MLALSTPDEMRAFVQGSWANVAAAWEAHADEIDQRAVAVTERMIEMTEPGRGDRVLELASGPGGAGLAAAARVGPSCEVLISDVVPAMVDSARRRAAARGCTGVTTAVLDLEAIAEGDASFDVVLCREGLMFAIDPARAAREMHRVLRRHGRVAVAVWASPHENPWLGLLLDAIREVTGIVVPPPGAPGPFVLQDRQGLRRLFIDAGFSGITVVPVPVPLLAASFEAGGPACSASPAQQRVCSLGSTNPPGRNSRTVSGRRSPRMKPMVPCAFRASPWCWADAGHEPAGSTSLPWANPSAWRDHRLLFRRERYLAPAGVSGMPEKGFDPGTPSTRLQCRPS